MIGSNLSGNPNVIDDTKNKQTGPKTEIGKVKNSLNAVRSGATSKLLDEAIELVGIKFKKASEALAVKTVFAAWWKSKSGEDLTEIAKLDQVIQILDSDMSIRAMGKLEKGIPLDEDDIKLIRLLKDCLSTSHELKFGKKNLNVHANYDDIRKMMFDDNP